MYSIPQIEILRRRDMRDVLTFTIDPEDANDFDDAISFDDLDDGTYQVGVHIADVSHFVQPGSAIDDDAYTRGTSTYLVDRVEPMLPEELCNDLCSLRPDEDKLCMSVVFTMANDATVIKHKVCRTVIRSNRRLTYEQAQAIIENREAQSRDITETIPRDDQALSKAISVLMALAKRMRDQRFRDGALDLEQEEMRFRLDENGRPVEIYFKKPKEANWLIEEWMLLANRTVAKDLYGHPMVWRVHDIPDAEKMRQLGEFKRRARQNGIAKKMGSEFQSVIDMLTVRAMAKAEYSTRNIGHYGLRFAFYTHFTSPIRRYPDLIVHRLVAKHILGERDKGHLSNPSSSNHTDITNIEWLEEACKHLSACEVDAQLAERESLKYYQALWLEDHVGEEADGHITGVTEFGLFVRLDDSRCEGLVHVSTLGNAYWQYDEKNYRLIADSTGETYTLGDKVRVNIVRVDAPNHKVDFTLIKDF